MKFDVSEPSFGRENVALNTERDGFTLEDASVLLPDLLRLFSSDYLETLSDDDIALRLNRIDRLFDLREMKMELRKIILTARMMILGDIKKRFGKDE